MDVRPGHGRFRILIIRLSAIGDVVLCSYLIRNLRIRFPEAEIDFLVKSRYASIPGQDRRIDHVLEMTDHAGLGEILHLAGRLRKNDYDVVLDLQGNARSIALSLLSGAKKKARCRAERLNRFMLVHFKKDLYTECVPVPLRYAGSVRFLGLRDDGMGLDFFVSPEADEGLARVEKKMDFPGEGRLIVLAPGAGRKTKRWPAGRYAELGDHFSRTGCRIALVGGDQDREACLSVLGQMKHPAFDFSGRLSLQESAALIRKASLVVANDTGMMHVACGLGIPVAAIFGPTTRHFGFMPFRAVSAVLECSLDCRPCSYHGSERCPESHFGCMDGISVPEVIRAAENLMQESQ